MDFIFELIGLLISEFFNLGVIIFGGLFSLIPGWFWLLFIILFVLSLFINLHKGLKKRKK